MPEFKIIPSVRIVARASALDAAAWPQEGLALRVAPDEMLFANANTTDIAIDDPHAIITRDACFAGAWVRSDEALVFLTRACEWELPSVWPAFAQGAVAGLPVKLWFEAERVLFLVPAAYAADLEERMA